MSQELEDEGQLQPGSSPLLTSPIPACEDGSTTKGRSCLSAATDAHFRALDDRLAQVVPEKKQQAEPRTLPERNALSFPLECAFGGWSGNAPELEETPKSKDDFVAKLHEARNQCDLVQRTLCEYQMEINTNKHRRFGLEFLKNQNEAAAVTHHQLNQISAKLDEVIEQADAISDDVKGRVLYDNHVWYKLNYSLSAPAKTEKTLG
ncbi:hypothetical protein DV735_g933, partial [Chaetothyriales sp. CBS 134920]